MGGPRKKTIHPLVQWRVVHTGFGTLVIRDAEGRDPLRHPDPLTRAVNLYLAAGAPLLKQALQAVLNRYLWFESPYGRDDEISHLGQFALGATVLPIGEIVRASKSKQQAELELEAA